jgi:hypothetical protein
MLEGLKKLTIRGFDRYVEEEEGGETEGERREACDGVFRYVRLKKLTIGGFDRYVESRQGEERGGREEGEGREKGGRREDGGRREGGDRGREEGGCSHA